ncbi:MAG: rRNA maturation RNase YbeY [Bacteroidota bacterium]
MSILFHKEEIEVQLPDEKKLTQWLCNIAGTEDKKVKQVTYIFCDDEYLLEINKQFLNHDFYTDIITFPYKQGSEIESDIFISVDRVRENATLYKVDFDRELLRVIAHGLLHLMGYKDKTKEEEKVMRAQEDLAIERFYEL